MVVLLALTRARARLRTACIIYSTVLQYSTILHKRDAILNSATRVRHPALLCSVIIHRESGRFAGLRGQPSSF